MVRQLLLPAWSFASSSSNAWGHVKVSDNALDKKIFDLRSTLKEISDRVQIKSVYGVGIQLEI